MPVRDLLSAASGGASYGPSDPYFDYVGAQLSGDGTNGATNNTFVDSSTNNFTITRNGNTTQGSFSPYGSLWSNYFNGGSTDRLSFPSSSAFNFYTNDFTIEFWCYPTDSGTQRNLSYGSGDSGNVTYLSNKTLQCYFGGGGYLSGTTALVPGQWTHVAISRIGSSASLYINGVLDVNNSSFSPTNTGNQSFNICRPGAASFLGYISNFRIVNGTAIYNPSSSSITVPTAPLTAVANTSLLTCQSNSFIDNSSNAFTVTVNGVPQVTRFAPFNPTAPYNSVTLGGSGYFNGSDNLTNTGSAIGSGDYTLEYWIYPTSSATLQGVFSTSGGGTTGVLRTGIYQSKLYVDIYSGTGSVNAGSNITLNQWTHVAITKSGSSYTSYLNGAVNTTWSDSTDITGTDWKNGMLQNTSNFFTGYISNLRLVVGSVVYTGAFTPPTAPVTAITNTQFLLNYTNAGISDLAMQNDWISNGGTQVSTSVKKFGTGSIYLNSGSLQCYPLKNVAGIARFNRDFTWEWWFYPTNGSNNFQGGGLSYRDGGFSSGGFQSIYDGTTGTINFIFDGGGTQITGDTITNNSWNYITLVRENGTLSIYINGTRKNTASYTNTITGGGTSTLGFFIGDTYDGNHYYVEGYMDDIRITNGYARYSGTTMTVPTATLPTY